MTVRYTGTADTGTPRPLRHVLVSHADRSVELNGAPIDREQAAFVLACWRELARGYHMLPAGSVTVTRERV